MKITIPSFATTTTYPNLVEAINVANRLFQGEGHFFEEIRSIASFPCSVNKITHNKVSGSDVASLLARNILITVETYQPKFRGTSANATTLDGSTIIRLNMYKLQRPTEELVGTLVHECVHIADNLPDMSFGHGSNFFSRSKQDTAPYRIDQIAQRIAFSLKTV